MQSTGSTKKFLSVVAVSIFLISMFYAGSAATLPASNISTNNSLFTWSQKEAPPTGPEPSGEDGTYVGWSKDSNSTSDTWTWDNKQWLFGPRPEYKIYHENGSIFGEDDYAEVDEWLTFAVIVPKDIFSGNATIDTVTINGWYMTSDFNFSANFNLQFHLWDGIVNWDVYSSEWNATEPDSETPPETPAPSFIDVDSVNSSYNNDTMNEYVNFVVRFTEDAPIGMYSLDMYVMDTDYNSYSQNGYNTGWEFRGIALGIPPSAAMAVSFGGSFTLQKLGLSGDTIYSVSRNGDFVMRFNVTGSNLGIVRLALQLPEGMDTLVNVTSDYLAPITTTGGWEYDHTLHTYVWNASVVVTTYEWTYGTHEERRWSEFNTWKGVNVTRLYWEWNETSGQNEPVIYNETQWVPSMAYYIYNVTSGTWTEEYGFTVWGYPYDHYVEGVGERDILVTEPYPINLPKFYELNFSRCLAREINNQLVVDFVGHFTDKMPPTNRYESVRFRAEVFDVDGNPWGPATWGNNPLQTDAEFNMAQQVAIESPVTIAWLLTADGKNPPGWTFQVDKGQYFQVKAELQGGSSIADDIDAAFLQLNAYDGTWSENETTWSSLSYEISYAMDGSPTLTAYNYTTLTNLTYGTYWDYVQVNKTGWHKEYNATSGMTEYVFGSYQIWEWGEVEGWTWTTWYFNQQTGKWQKEWIPARGPDTIVPSAFCTTENFTKWTEDGNLYVSFLVNMSATVPDTTYWWAFSFMNNTWHEDYDSSWGMHPVYSWGIESVYSFDYQGTSVYVDQNFENQLAYSFLNGTLGSAFMMGREAPYVVINDEKLPIQPTTIYDPGMMKDVKRLFFFDHYDATTSKNYYYYELVNGTRLPVTYIDGIWIYNVTVSNGDSFLTAQDWDMYWAGNGGSGYYYWVDIYGDLHQGDWEYSGSSVNITPYDFVTLTNWTTSKFVRYGDTGLLNISEYWWDSAASTYFIMDVDGILYQLQYDSMTTRYMMYIDGSWQFVSWFEQYYIGQYDGKPVMLTSWNVDRFWYFEDGNGLMHEMPYPGAAAVGEYDLDHLISEGGTVPSIKSLIYNGTFYPVHKVNESLLYTIINGTTYRVGESFQRVIIANGTIAWNPTVSSSTAEVGTYTGNQMFSPLETVEYYSNEWGQPLNWSAPNHCYLYELTNGTNWLVNATDLVNVYLVDLDGKQFYSWFNYPYSRQQDNYTVYFYIALNGSEIELGTNYRSLPVLDITHAIVYENASHSLIDFNNQTYIVHDNTYISTHLRIVNGTTSAEVYLSNSYPIYQFDYMGSLVNASAHMEPIRRLRYVWGYAYVYGPEPIDSAVYKNFDSIVIGVPEWGMWDFKNWAIDPTNGALDLDGNFDTTSDQYYVLEEYESTDSWTHSWDHMDVWLTWDPNGTAYGDEMHVNSWLGVDTFTWNYTWSQSFYWYHADDFSKVNSTEMDGIKDTLMFSDGTPRAGYWGVAWMAQNMTWEDILAQAQENGWDWFDQGGQTWTWLSFGIDQNYGTSTMVGDVEHWLDIGLHYEYSGLMLWKDTNDDGVMTVDVNDPSSSELTHFLIPDSVESVSFVTPGEAYGDLNASGWLHLNLTEEVTWGVTFHNVNGTVFPFTQFGYWGWYDGVVTGSDMRTFDERPTKVSIDELSFLVHFQGTVSTSDINNQARIKVDNYVGNWNVDLLGGRDNLENRSLALNYFSEVRMSDFAFKANGTFADSESTVSSDRFDLETSGARFAEMIMGGVTYDWGKNLTAPYDVLSYTTPLGTFRTAFESDSGKSATAWSFSSSMYMVTIGFPEWEGFSVNQDPVFVSYVSASGVQGGLGPVTFGAFSIEPSVPTSSDSVTIRGDIYTSEQINEVSLLYSIDGTNWESNSMWNENANTWAGTIPPFDEGTQVYFRVVVSTPSGNYESMVQSYVVGQGMVTIITTTPPYTGGGSGISSEMLIMVGGIAVVVVVLVVIVTRRRR
ncbi:MAG: hypothetical protein ACTSYL_03830 [Candidatus Thorarchaeota archaeon]